MGNTINISIDWEEEPSAGNIVINEVYYDAIQSGTDTNYEWVELYNPGGSSVNISEWVLEDNSTTDELPPSTIDSGEFLIVATTESGFTTNFPSFTGNVIYIGPIGGGLSNTGDRLIIRDSEGVVVDSMSYGNNNSVWDPDCPDIAEGHSLERSPAGKDSNTPGDFINQPSPTPGLGL